MKASNMLVATLREVPAEAEIASHQLMLRAGLMRKLAAGVYAYLPQGYKSLRKVEQIIREEMDRAGAEELLMSALLPAESYQESGRWDVFGPEMFRLKDRNDRDFCLGPTHEEIFTEAVKSIVKSYRSLPHTLYQIQTKYRDERRPRFGVLRSREFIMKDAYSFDVDEKGLDISYQAMYKAYCRIFDRLGLDYTVVDADSGAMGGSGSQEFMVKSDIGEDGIAYCDACGYAANEEKAVCIPEEAPKAEPLPLEKVATPGAKTIEDLTQFFDCDAKTFAKTLLYVADGKVVAAMVRGDRTLNEVKLKNALGCTELEMADAITVRNITGAEVGFAGPIGLDIPVYADLEVSLMKNFVIGANETDVHYKNVNFDRDFTVKETLDLRTIESGDPCPKCGKPVGTAQGIEVGHIFKLGTKYSEKLGCNYVDANGKEIPMVMGCYGIGVNRCMAAVIEQNHDEDGIIWPVAIAPYHVDIVQVGKDRPEQTEVSEKLYDALQKAGVEVILDERDERPGVKFKDADLLGYPIRITVGKKAGEGIVEFKLRKSKEVEELSVDEAIAKAVEFVKAGLSLGV